MSRPITDDRLSYSSSTLLSNCEQKYYYYKIEGSKKDSDAEEDSHAFRVGKAFHFVLEKTLHKCEPASDLVREACLLHQVPEDQALIHAMVLKYSTLHTLSGLECIAVEKKIETKEFIGFTDAVFIDPGTLRWWIVDLKTAARVSDSLTARLHSDTQLNLYAYFKDYLAAELRLDRERFAGTRYRVTTKSSSKQKSDEDYKSYVTRLYHTIDSIDVEVPVEMMNPEEAYNRFTVLHEHAKKLREGKERPIKNLSYCDSFFKPCEYWSKCHGDIYTNCKSKLFIRNSDYYKSLRVSEKGR